MLSPIYRRLSKIAGRLFYSELIGKTDNFRGLTWLGQPVWQNPLDIWNLQEVVCQVKPSLFVECGTNRGGSSLFVAHLMDIMGHGRIVTIDVERLHDLSHPRITYLLGSSVDPSIVAQVTAMVDGPVLVMLDSDHSSSHVFAELEAYAPLVTPGSYCFVQDGIIDTESRFAGSRPGPLDAIERFLPGHPEFEVDEARSNRFIVTHHPKGWLKRLSR